jgi:hypothetical protein
LLCGLGFGVRPCATSSVVNLQATQGRPQRFPIRFAELVCVPAVRNSWPVFYLYSWTCRRVHAVCCLLRQGFWLRPLLFGVMLDTLVNATGHHSPCLKAYNDYMEAASAGRMHRYIALSVSNLDCPDDIIMFSRSRQGRHALLRELHFFCVQRSKMLPERFTKKLVKIGRTHVKLVRGTLQQQRKARYAN